METTVVRATSATIRTAANVIRAGGLVAFPTETVYGLGANAFDMIAVKKIFVAKKRPAHDPLIVHVCSQQMLKTVARTIPPLAQLLIKKFWPGPLTLILPKSSLVPGIVTSQQDTVAVRMPANPVALQLIQQAGVPIAAPSANLFGQTSPTSATHVFHDLQNRIPLILDGGRTRIGVESTILSLVGTPTILRKGGVSVERLRQFIPALKYHTAIALPAYSPRTRSRKRNVLSSNVLFSGVHSSGLLPKHYRPRTPLILIVGSNKEKLAKQLLHEHNAKIMCLSTRTHLYKTKAAPLGKTLTLAAKNLYRVMRELDAQHLKYMLVEEVAEKGIGVVIMDRLRRAAKKTI